MAVPADRAISVATDFCMEFNQKVKKHSLTTSASIVICHDSLPIKNILESAEGLLKNAKIRSREANKTYLDFIAFTGAAMEDVVAKRKKELQYQDYAGIHSLTLRPYFLDDLKKLTDAIRSFKIGTFQKTR
jgi:hypothetical protein